MNPPSRIHPAGSHKGPGSTRQSQTRFPCVATMEQTVKHVRELTRIAEVEINTIIQSCRRARQHMLETQTMERPGTLH